MKNKNIIFVSLLLIFIIISPINVMAHEHNLEEVEQIIKDKVPCEELTEEQLESIGEYYMEQMHPGEAHDIMDEMMGGEGSESLKQVHINMARSFYCGESSAMSANMMNMMMGRESIGMMGSGRMMGNMMSNYRIYRSNFIWVIEILIIIALVLLIVLLIRKLQKTNLKQSKKKS